MEEEDEDKRGRKGGRERGRQIEMGRQREREILRNKEREIQRDRGRRKRNRCSYFASSGVGTSFCCP